MTSIWTFVLGTLLISSRLSSARPQDERDLSDEFFNEIKHLLETKMALDKVIRNICLATATLSSDAFRKKWRSTPRRRCSRRILRDRRKSNIGPRKL
jgi:hypothetical protein